MPQWGEPVGLVVSELVTNAVRHARSSTTVRLVPADTGVVVEVDDAAENEPQLLPPNGRSASGGLGLAIVDRLAEAWGFSPRPAGGKTVWARLRLPDPLSRPDAGDAADEVVVLELPWDKDMVGMLRSTAGHLAVRAGFQRREMEDLRLATDEIFSLLYAQRPDRPDLVSADGAITCRFLVGPGRVGLDMSAQVVARRVPDAEDFGWHLLQALVDEIAWCDGDRSCGVRAEKRKGAES